MPRDGAYYVLTVEGGRVVLREGDRCGHGVPLTEECDGCAQDARASDDAPVHGPCNYNCGSPSCDAPEYPREDA